MLRNIFKWSQLAFKNRFAISKKLVNGFRMTEDRFEGEESRAKLAAKTSSFHFIFKL